MPLVVDDKSEDNAVLFEEAVGKAIRNSDDEDKGAKVAFDCEGWNLGRTGSLELVSVCFGQDGGAGEGDIFLVDVHMKVGEQPSSPRARDYIEALKKLLECPTVLKVIHDCRMDCDALYHILGIELSNVHDTSCYHQVVEARYDIMKNLNNVLAYNCLPENFARDKAVYERNPRFWADRPLTPQMIDWASADVKTLLTLASRQKEALECRGKAFLEQSRDMSTNYTRDVHNMNLESNVTLYEPVARFIGTKGKNLHGLERRTGTLLYRDSVHPGKWMIYYENRTALESVKPRWDTCSTATISQARDGTLEELPIFFMSAVAIPKKATNCQSFKGIVE